jgi:CMP-N-acetylneuraminic acid synthetase
MRVLGLVPARGGSTRLPGKNLARLGGTTLVRRALETALAAHRIDEVVLSSDSPDILAEAAGLPVLAHARPAALATDTALAFDVALDALAVAEERFGAFDVLALVQCTTPFTAAEDLDAALGLLEARPEESSVVTITQAPDLAHPLKLKRLDGARLVPFLEDDALTPSHDLPQLWVRNGALYASRVDTLRTGRLVGAEPLAHPMPAERSIDVNTPLDLAFCEFLLQRSHPELEPFRA